MTRFNTHILLNVTGNSPKNKQKMETVHSSGRDKVVLIDPVRFGIRVPSLPKNGPSVLSFGLGTSGPQAPITQYDVFIASHLSFSFSMVASNPGPHHFDLLNLRDREGRADRSDESLDSRLSARWMLAGLPLKLLVRHQFNYCTAGNFCQEFIFVAFVKPIS